MKLSCTDGVVRDRSFELSMKAMAVPTWPKYVGTEQFIRMCSEMGFEGVDLTDKYLEEPKKEYLKTLKKLSESLDLDTPHFGIHNNFLAPGRLREEVEYVKHWLELSTHLKAETARIFVGFRPEEMSKQDAFDLSLKGVKAVLPTAEKLGVTLVLELHPTYPGEDMMAVTTLINLVDSEYLGVCLDFAWTGLPPPRNYLAIELLSPYIRYVHAKSHEFNDEGEETTINYGKAIDTLKKSGYDGWVMVEYEGKASSLDEALEGVRNTLRLLKRHI